MSGTDQQRDPVRSTQAVGTGDRSQRVVGSGQVKLIRREDALATAGRIASRNSELMRRLA